MKNFKLIFVFLFISTLFFTSCQKDATEQSFDKQVAEQNELIPDTPENFEKEKVAPTLEEKQLKTSGMQSHLDRPKTEATRKTDNAQSRSASWIDCGMTINSTTLGAGNHYTGTFYQNGCLSEYYSFDAPDKTYLLYVPQEMDVSLKLSNMNSDLDLFIFTAGWSYNPQHCIGYSINSNYNSENISLRLNPGVYVILVDGYRYDKVSSFKLSVTCGGDDDCENFDTYYTGNISNQSYDWRKWNSSAYFDGQVSNYRYASYSQSLYIDHKPGYSDAHQPDVVKRIGEYTSGNYIVKWKMYVPGNRNAAFNFQKYNAPGVDTGVAVYLRKGRGIAIQANNHVYQSTETYRQNTWIDIEINYDLSGGMAVLSVDNKLIAAWDTRLRATSPYLGANRLGGIDFWAYHEATTFYVDDVCVDDISGLVIDYYFGPNTIFIGLH